MLIRCHLQCVGVCLLCTLLAASSELMSVLSSSLLISMATVRSAPFSLTSRLRLSRGVLRDEILSLDRANCREKRKRGLKVEKRSAKAASDVWFWSTWVTFSCQSKSCRVAEEMLLVLFTRARRISSCRALRTLSTASVWLLFTSDSLVRTCTHPAEWGVRIWPQSRFNQKLQTLCSQHSLFI